MARGPSPTTCSASSSAPSSSRASWSFPLRKRSRRPKSRTNVPYRSRRGSIILVFHEFAFVGVQLRAHACFMRLCRRHYDAVHRRAALSAQRSEDGPDPARGADAAARPPRRNPARHLGRPGAGCQRSRAAPERRGRELGRKRGARGARPGDAGRGAQAHRRRATLSMIKRTLALILLAAAAALWAQTPPPPPPAPAPDVAWPRERKTDDGTTITVFQPQLERWADNNLSGRAAVSVMRPGEKEPHF